MASFNPTAAGDYNRRLTILTPQAGPTNELGGTTGSPVAVRTIWAKVVTLTGLERNLNAAVSEDTTHIINMRYVPFIDHTCTLVMQGRKFDIDDVIDLDEARTELLITAHEQKGA